MIAPAARRGAVARALLATLVAALVAAPAGAPAAPARASLLFVNGRILAGVDSTAAGPAARWVEALLVHDGRVVFAGTRAEAEVAVRALPRAPRRVDLAGRFAGPGFHDAHGHVASLGFALARLRLEGTTSAAEVAARVAEAARARRAGEWILGRGWDQNDWAVKAFPTRADLDAATTRHPVWLRRVDGHAGWANSEALRRAGITAATPDPPGGRIHRHADGTPSGVLVDNAMALVDRALPAAGAAETRDAIARALEHCARLGLTSVQDAGIGARELAAYRALAARGALPVRVFAMLAADAALASGGLDAVRDGRAPATWRAGDGLFRVFAVKAYADGALGSRGAALLAPYADDPGNLGLLVTPPDTLELLARRCLETGLQLCTHAIGDRGNRLTLEAYARAARDLPGGEAGFAARRFRIEHAQIVAPEDLPRFARLGVIASMQPTHCPSDMPWAPARLGEARLAGAYAWRALLDAGARLALGSDFPAESADPRLGLHAAVTTQDADGRPPGGHRPGQRLTPLEALRGFTSDAAFAAFADGEIGRLDRGLRADLAVWDRDLTAVPPRELLDARCVMTVVDGRVVWEAEEMRPTPGRSSRARERRPGGATVPRLDRGAR
uniref:Amidohydrolase n=1 Tax=Eiseniibacteriota bacterium TaxID=2212470 RepID=A0A832I2U0_UNCEI